MRSEAEMDPERDKNKEQKVYMGDRKNIENQSGNAKKDKGKALEVTDKPKLSYSGAVRKNQPKKKVITTDTWSSRVLRVRAEQRENELDTEYWGHDRLMKIVENEDKVFRFVKQKIKTRPTTYNILTAIQAKFKYIDIGLFRTFARRKDKQLQYQKEYIALYEMALKKYKKHYKVTYINKFNRDYHSMKLRQKTAWDYITNLDFLMLRPHDCTRYIFFYLNFAKIESKVSFERMKTLLFIAHEELLQSLPEDYRQIQLAILEATPYPIPIKDRNHTVAVVAALKKVYEFDKLSENYFELPGDELFEKCKDLHPDVRKFFPITDRADLNHLADYRKKLQKYYNMDKIPEGYFQLLKEKPWLPNTFQQLNLAVQKMFPCNPKDDVDFRRYVNTLRDHYKFNKIKVKEFIAEIEEVYKFSIPLPVNYMTINPTEKPELPENPEEISEMNLTISIQSPKILVEVARELRKTYFFYRIPKT
ncbi:hypothetical protein F8M41_001672 [Gigaspora margarita]|uniref:Uncharacterized protein n=1 Tax=Gigaspora margarita TaxID=4874 RepID=A0A8H3XGJ3_GIGMA|nr:hypothetical protein F8M41_001672 [Gigaspora margarita]